MRLIEFLNITETPDAFLQDFKGIIRGQLGKQGVDITMTKLDDRTVELDNIDVSPAFRGRGLGTKAMNALIALADKHNTRIFLYPLEDNEEDIDLQDWYGRLGFSHYADQVHGIYMLYDPSGGLSVNPMSESAIPSIPWYHGTGTSSRLFRLPKDPHPSGIGLWFTANKEVADTFARRAVRMIDEVPQVAEVRVNSNNPKHYHDYREYLDDWGKYNDARKLRNALKRKGHDAVVIDHSTTDIDIQRVDIAVFNIRQIRIVNVEQLAGETGR